MFFLLSLSSFAQSLVFHNYSTNDGLLAHNVGRLMQDRQGFLWIVSTEGIQRFDGTAFTSFSGKKLPYTTIYEIDQDKEGNIWAASLGGLLKLTNDSFRVVWPPEADSSVWIHSLLAASDTSIWFAGNPGLFRMKGGITEHITLSPGPMDGTIIVESANGNIWINREDRLWICNPTTRKLAFREFTIDAHAEPWTILPDKDSTMWILTGDRTLLRYRDTTLLGKRNNLTQREAICLVDDGEGNLWIGGWDGLTRLPKNKFETAKPHSFNEKNGLPQSLVLCGLHDGEGNLWFGTNSGGLVKLSDQHTYSFSLPYKFRGNNNMDAAVDSQNHIWINSQDDGLEEIFREGENWYRFKHKFNSTESTPRSIAVDPNGHLWVSHVNGYLFRYSVQHGKNRPSRLRELGRMLPGRGLPTGEHHAITFDSSGNLFLSVLQYGVVVIDMKKMKVVYAFDASIKNIESIRAIEIDHNRGVWLGDFSRGLTLVTGWQTGRLHVRHFTHKDGLPNDGIRALHGGSDGMMWIGTRYGGIAVFDGSLFRPIAMEEGINSNAVWCLAEDTQKRVWLGSPTGLEAIDMRTLEPLPHKTELSRYSIAACGTISENIVWGLGGGSLIIHEQVEARKKVKPPPVYLKNIIVNQTPIDEISTSQLSYNQNNLRFSFVGISFRDERAIQYQTRLLGLEQEWREPTSLGEATFASLASGTYRFEVKAINAAGMKSENAATFDFTIAPPFWKTWWFLSLSLIVVIGLIALAVRVRVKRLLEVERIRTHIATDLHDDIGSGLTRIAVLSDVAARKAVGEPGSVLPILEKMGTSARELHDAMGDVIWSIDPVHDSLESVVGRLKVFANEICAGGGIELDFSREGVIDTLKLNPHSLRSLLLIGKEALSNAATHSQCTKIAVRLAVDGQRIILSVADNGKGFRTGREGGNGLNNMKRRATKSGGSINISSDEGRGTAIEARIPA